MFKITRKEDFQKIGNNRVLGSFPDMNNSVVVFVGEENILFCEEGVVLENSNISFNGNNSIIYLGKSNKPYMIECPIFNNSVVHFGKNNFFSSKTKMVCSEEKHIFVGNDNIFSHEVVIRNSDAHLIYDIATKSRVNFSKSIFIGDHVWLGHSSILLKGAKVHSGSIIGAKSVVTKELKSNNSYAGIPVKRIKQGVFWKRDCVHSWTEKETDANLKSYDEDFIYNFEENVTLDFDELDKNLTNFSTEKKIQFLDMIANNNSKNRFSG